jgi:hypothetical protein
MCVDADEGLAGRVHRMLCPAYDVEVISEASLDRTVERFDQCACDALLVTGAAVCRGEQDIGLLEVVAAKSPATQILFLADRRDIRLVISALRAGSYHCLRLPLPRIRARVNRWGCDWPPRLAVRAPCWKCSGVGAARGYPLPDDLKPKERT